jgi:5'-nucleotidase
MAEKKLSGGNSTKSIEPVVVGVSTTALFDLSESHKIFEKQGVAAYRKHQRERERKTLKPGTAFPLIRAMLDWNRILGPGQVEVVIISHNAPDTAFRVINSLKAHKLPIEGGAFTAGREATPYLPSFNVSLFLSTNENDVRSALCHGVPAGLVYARPRRVDVPLEEVRFAFDGDAVVFSDQSEKVFQRYGLEAFRRHEKENARNPIPLGPFARFLRLLATLQARFDPQSCPIRTALVTTRGGEGLERVLRSLRTHDLRVDESYFMSGRPKETVLEQFRPHIFFDDAPETCRRTAGVVPTAHVVHGVRNPRKVG